MRHKPQSIPTPDDTLLEQEAVNRLVLQAISAVCKEVAVKEGITLPEVEPLVLESMAAAVDECMLQVARTNGHLIDDVLIVMLLFLSKVRRSMLAARRTCPIAPDFETVISVFDIPRLDDQLQPYKSRPNINPPLYPTPPPEDEFHNLVELPASFLGPDLDGHGELNKFGFGTKALPALPSAHTYKDTAVFPHRESDTRKIRELATHEGKLGEQALRKLAGAVKLDAAHAHVLETTEASVKQKSPPSSRPPRRKRWKTGVDLSEEAVFEETLRELLKKEPGGYELGPIVTCEKSFRMPDDVAVKRKAPAAPDGGAGSSHDGEDTAMQL